MTFSLEFATALLLSHGRLAIKEGNHRPLPIPGPRSRATWIYAFSTQHLFTLLGQANNNVSLASSQCQRSNARSRTKWTKGFGEWRIKWPPCVAGKLTIVQTTLNVKLLMLEEFQSSNLESALTLNITSSLLFNSSCSWGASYGSLQYEPPCVRKDSSLLRSCAPQVAF